eukprot:TRINITY_DN27256_c0_g1_i2.p1 TRINITY_DN27256_c0_g1~~TRINITY_DN27256_c0_g1_i2.p1  ORF type:complete len:122 (-),score=13.55 TRINITY_DN27256_c0_g1_i2:220-585(-)
MRLPGRASIADQQPKRSKASSEIVNREAQDRSESRGCSSNIEALHHATPAHREGARDHWEQKLYFLQGTWQRRSLQHFQGILVKQSLPAIHLTVELQSLQATRQLQGGVLTEVFFAEVAES